MALLLFNSLLLGIGLAMDAFSVAIANGLGEPCMRRRKMYLIAGVFAFLQGLMPFIGWFFVHTLTEMFSVLQAFIPWIALGLLSFIGAKMLFDGVDELHHKEKTDPCDSATNRLTLGTIFVQGIATSIDALSVGFTIVEYDVIEALISSLVICAVTFIICLFGVMMGKRFGTLFAGKSSVFGGIILIAIGIEIFITSFI